MVVAALAHLQKPASPQDIAQRIGAEGDTINTVTVYRILATLEEWELVHRHPCNGQYSLCSLPTQSGHHGFLHCSSCGSVEEFLSAELCKLEDRIARASRFQSHAHVSEIVGLCKFCHV